MSKKLTIKQESFCQHYILNGGNASKAYRKSYNVERMKHESINVNACKLLKNTNVALRVEELRNEIYERNKATIDEVLSIGADMLRADIADAFDEHGNLKNIHSVPKKLRRALLGVETNELKVDNFKVGEIKKIKLSDRSKILELFMKHFGLFEKNNEQKNAPTIIVTKEETRQILDDIEEDI